MLKIHALAHSAKQHQRPEEECQSEQKIAGKSMFLLPYKKDADNERWKDYTGEVYAVSQRHNPRRESCSDVGTHNYGYCLSQGKQSGRNERHRHDRCCRRRLHGACNKRSGKHSAESVRGHPSKNVSQTRACHFLQGIAHHLHSVNKKSQRTEQFKNNVDSHFSVVVFYFRNKFTKICRKRPHRHGYKTVTNNH